MVEKIALAGTDYVFDAGATRFAVNSYKQGTSAYNRHKEDDPHEHNYVTLRVLDPDSVRVTERTIPRGSQSTTYVYREEQRANALAFLKSVSAYLKGDGYEINNGFPPKTSWVNWEPRDAAFTVHRDGAELGVVQGAVEQAINRALSNLKERDNGLVYRRETRGDLPGGGGSPSR